MEEQLATPGAPLTVEIVAESGTTTVLGMSGELDLSSVPILDQAISNALARDGVELLVLDVSNLSFMDSSGIAALLKVTEGGVGVQLRSPSRIIRDVIAATHLEETLRLDPGSDNGG